MPHRSKTSVHPEKVQGATLGSQHWCQQAPGPGLRHEWGACLGAEDFSSLSQDRVTVEACFPAQERVMARVLPARWACPLDIWFLISDSQFHAFGSPQPAHNFL